MIPSKKVIAFAIISISIVATIYFIVAAQEKKRQEPQIDEMNQLVAQRLVDKIMAATFDVSEEEARLRAEEFSGRFDGVIDEEMSTSTTYQFSKVFFKEYLEARSQGRMLTQAEIDNLINRYVRDNPAEVLAFAVSDMVVANTETPESIRAYGNTVGRILRENTPIITQTDNELFAVLRSIYSEDPNQLNTTVQIAAAYQNSLRQLRTIPVPPSALERHMTYMNASLNMLQNIRDMSLYESDPLRAMRAIQDYPVQSTRFGNAYNQLGYYFFDRGIVFSTSEDGYALQTGL